jgi:hypothetical protein
VVDNFVVHGAAAQRMRMADQRGKRRIGRAFVQQRLQPACGTGRSTADLRAGMGLLGCRICCGGRVRLWRSFHSSFYALRAKHLFAGSLVGLKSWKGVLRYFGGEASKWARQIDLLLRYPTRRKADGETRKVFWQHHERSAFPPIHLIPSGLPARCAKSSPPPTTRARWAIFWPISCRARLGRGEDPGAAAGRERHGGPRWNVYAGHSRRDARPGLFHAHGHRSALHPFSEDAEFMYGRGVSDAKGIIAAQVAAAEALRAAGFRIGLLFVSGEERDSAGAKAANLRPRAAAS